jgi:hypothetical protein
MKGELPDVATGFGDCGSFDFAELPANTFSLTSYCTTWFTTADVLVLEAASPL